jgi:GT2 family glycosyltransferase
MDISVILVSYNTRELLRKCLASVFASSTVFKYEVLVSDNGSSDGSQEMVKSEFPQARLIENGENLGFSKGNNVAIRQAGGRYVLLLNSDTEVEPDTLDLSVRYMDNHPETGIMGCKVLLPDGSPDKASRRRFPDPYNSFMRLFGFKHLSNYNIQTPEDMEVEVDSVMGAFLMIRRETTDKIGLLDEQFFMYGEDLDWCWRAKEAGYKVMYFPRAKITHFKYGSSQTVPFKTICIAHNAMRIFYRKHYAASHNPAFNLFVYCGIWLRMYSVLFVNFFRKKKSVH